MEYYAIYLPYKEPELSIKSFYNDKEEALKVLKSHKEARLKAFRTSEEAVYFYLNGPSDPVPSTAPKSPTSSASKLKLEKTPFKAPKSQELVAFRKNIEKNELDMVRNIVQLNPRYLVSSGDMPTILKEGPRYNALHVGAIEGNTDMCKLILQTIEHPGFIEFLHGQRNPSTDEVSAILLDLYLNMPDKCRSETPLHFAAKFGSAGVVEVLISYPQCKMTRNSDGHLPKDIICSRAKSKNDTPEIRKAIADLLQERFFVPVLRAVDNSAPPVVGEPFTLSNPPNLESKDRFSPKLEIKAYAGPMDKEKAQVFCKRWKTPPRLIPSPRFISPVKTMSSSKIPVSTVGVVSPLSSTPIAKKNSGRRALFPNRPFDLSLEQEEHEKSNSLNNNCEIEVVQEDADQEALEEQRQLDEMNGNKPVPKIIGGSFGMRASPVKKGIDGFLFRKYRERLQNSFATIYDDDDDDVDSGKNDTREELAEVERSVGNGEGNFSYFCDENNSFYEGTNITDSPSFKERKLRLTDTEKGLEIIGRTLAEDHEVGWNEYWSFLGTFSDLRSNDGLQQLEDYLRKRQLQLDLTEQEALLKTSRLPVPVNKLLPSLEKPNDSLGSICDALDKMSLADAALRSSPQITAVTFRKRLVIQPSAAPPIVLEPEPIRSRITNPYLCLHNSLQVFAKRFVKNLDESSCTTMTMDFGSFFQQAVVDCVRKLNTMVDNYRKDAAFGSIDFSKVHSRYAQLIVINIEQQRETAQGVIHRLKVLLDKSRELNSASKYPDLQDSLICLQNFLDFYILKKAELMNGGCSQPDQESNGSQTEISCSRTWREDPLVHCCNCRIDGVYAKKGSLERLNKRREQRKKAAAAAVIRSNSSPMVPVLSGLVSSLERTASAGNFDTYRNPTTMAFGEVSDEEDEEYFSCSDSELEVDSDSDDANVCFETPPSSPSFFSQKSDLFDFSSLSSADDGVVSGDEKEDQFLDTNGDLDEEESSAGSSDSKEAQYRIFIEEQEPSKQDVDVLNVIEKRVIDQGKFPHVHEWRKAMLRLSVEERDRLSSKTQKSRWRAAIQGGVSVADLSNSIPIVGEQSPPGSPAGSVSKVIRTGSAGDAGSDNLMSASLNGQLSLMNVSDYAGKLHQRVVPAPPS
ncbi:ankyrin repeat and LEM domain-containing protein 2 homolog [Ochlerotatus camptorhynchus]|uniref:ankyrin repeat and LEM domain-containing protein 2 homolog n=1 Tax=Ochlerotatus camptorhynchus TaxID=644619 RepID=UPI0031DAF970